MYIKKGVNKMKTVRMECDYISKWILLEWAKRYGDRLSVKQEFTERTDETKLIVEIVNVTYDEFIWLVHEYESNLEKFAFHLATFGSNSVLFQGKGK